MSVVVTIKRLPEKPLLTGEEFRRVVEQDSSLSGGGQEPIFWTDPASGQERYINVDPTTGELETDDMRGDEDSICRFLDKLRTIARILDARVFGEGEDITEPTSAPARRAGCASVLVCTLAFVVVLVIVISNWR